MDAGERAFVTEVDRARDAMDGPALAALLAERHAAYAERGAVRVERMRAYVLAASARAGAPRETWPYVEEEIALGVDPYSVAAAAECVVVRPALARALAAQLEAARRRIAARNDRVALDRYDVLPEPTDPTALELVDRALAIARASSDCCALSDVRRAIARPERRALGPVLDDGVAEDSAGRRVLLGEHLSGRPALLAFFYTRCDNPQKCSVTMSRLGAITRALGEADASVVAITYDPSFDTPVRLEAYASARGFAQDDRHRVVRVTDGWHALEEALGLGVGFVGTLPNRHRVEAFAVDRKGQIAFTYGLGELQPEVVTEDLRTLLAEPMDEPPGHATAPLPGAVPSLAGLAAQLGLALMPRCPMCWAAYLGLLGLGDLGIGAYHAWIAPVLVLVASLQVWASWRRARALGDRRGLVLTLLGVAVVLLGSLVFHERAISLTGLALGVIGTLWTSVARFRAVSTGASTPPFARA